VGGANPCVVAQKDRMIRIPVIRDGVVEWNGDGMVYGITFLAQ